MENIGMIGGYCEEGFPLYYVNEQMVRMLGYDSRQDFEKGIAGKVVNTIHPDDLASGMNAHLAKPVIIDELKATLQEILK